jgi:hypothetical protein
VGDSDDLVISGGGSSAVATSELLTQAGDCDRVHRSLDDCRFTLDGIGRIGLPFGAQGDNVSRDGAAAAEIAAADAALADAHGGIRSAISRADVIRNALYASADAYGAGERVLSGLSEKVAARFGYLFGLALPVVAIEALPFVLGLGAVTAAGAGIAYLLTTPKQRATLQNEVQDWLREHSSALSDPLTVQLVRLTVMSLDDVAAGALHLPPAVVTALGEQGLGVLTVSGSALAIGTAANTAGLLRESSVSVTRGPSWRSGVADSFEERVERIPSPEEGEAGQIRIDRYEQADGTLGFEVYLSGTSDFSLVAGDQPLDLTSDVWSIGGAESGAYRAAADAMKDAGVTPGTPVMLTGHSQGGLIAAQLAASGDYRTAGLFTTGAPAGQVDVPASVPWLALEHTDDIVPALGGSSAHSDPVVVRREVFDGRPVDDSQWFPAHRRDEYEQTAALVDESRESRVAGVRRDFEAFGASAVSVRSTLYTSERTGQGR